MSSFLTNVTFAPVPSAFVEVAPSTLVATFTYGFSAEQNENVYIRPGNHGQQDYLNDDGAEWLLYTRSVMSYRIECRSSDDATGGASLIVMLGDLAGPGAPLMRECLPFHLMSDLVSHGSGIELPGLMARFQIRTASTDGIVLVEGSIIVRGL